MSLPSGEILTIGTELLLGEIVDSNSAFIARSLRQVGFNVFSTTTVGDNVDRIAGAVENSLARADFLITTGGLGPTIDDMTRQAVAQAAGAELEFSQELWRQVQERFARFGREPSDNNRRQAYLPHGAQAMENPIGTAPAFKLSLPQGRLYALPGVPSEMEQLLLSSVLPDLKQTFNQPRVIESRILRTAGVGESTLDEIIHDLEEWENPTLGLAAHPGRVDLRLTASAKNETAAAELLSKLEGELISRVGKYVYGRDEDSLEAVVLELLQQRQWQVVTVESGTGGCLAGAMSQVGAPFVEGVQQPVGSNLEPEKRLAQLMQTHRAKAGLALDIQRAGASMGMRGWLRTPDFSDDFDQEYGGPPSHAAAWGLSHLLERLRRRLI
jgi:competence/damage-inducible protein CinA-like protein